MFRSRLAVAALLGVALAAAATAQDARKFELSFKGKDGKLVPFYQEMKTTVAQDIVVQGQTLSQKQTSTFWYKWNPLEEKQVKEKDQDVTKLVVTQKIEGLEMSIDISGNPINYSSKDGTTTAGNPGLVDFFKALNGTEFTVTLGKNYKVEKVDGKAEFLKKLGTGSPQMEQLLGKVMTDDALREMTDPTFNLFPDSPKEPGKMWEKKTKLNLGPIGSYDLTYKLKYVAVETADGPHKGMDKIEIETVITYTAPKGKAEGLLFRIKEGSTLTSVPEDSKGVIYYDSKAKRIESAEIKIKLKGKLTVQIGNVETQVELIQQQTTSIKTKDTSFLAAPPKKP